MSADISTYNFPTKIRFGPGSRHDLIMELSSLGIQRPLIVTDRDVAKLPWFVAIETSLTEMTSVTFSGVWGNPVVSQVMTGVTVCQDYNADGIVAVGGGAPMDVAKAIALMANHPGHLFDYEDGASTRPIDRSILPIVAIPTTAGTGSEVGRSTVISDDETHAKKIIFDPQLLPKVVLADPELLLGLPAKITAATGMDALTHLIEAFLAKGNNPLCDGIALEGIYLVSQHLRDSVMLAQQQATETVDREGHLRARAGMLNASMMGAIAFQKYLAPRYAEVRERVGLLNGRLANNLTGIATIKSYTSEAYEIQRVGQDSEAYRQSNRRAIALSSAFIPLIRILILIGFTATLLYGGLEAVAGNLAVGTYSVLVFMTQRLLWPLTRLGETLDQYRRAMASINRVMDLLDTPVAIRTGDYRLPVSNVRGDIVFEDVTFAYHNRLPVVEHLTLKVPAGKTTAIVGATGSGKSTLVKLLLRFYEISDGQITLDGHDLRQLHLDDLRRAIGLVSQDVFLFHGTVAENIVYGSFSATPTEIEQAAKLAEAHEFIQQLPQGYDTIVGERGQKLSGGQRQRLAIARALLKDPPILILDEATSAVDNETEAAIQRSLEKITCDRTTIAIAHRLSTVRNAHCIYVMDQGQLAEWGTHEALLARDGIYANLWRVQMGERVLAL